MLACTTVYVLITEFCFFFKSFLYLVPHCVKIRTFKMEVKKVRQMKTMLPSLIPTSQIKSQRERPWCKGNTWDTASAYKAFLILVKLILDVNKQPKCSAHINKSHFSLILRVLCTQRFLSVWTRHCPRST